MLLLSCAASAHAQGTVTVSYRVGFDNVVARNKPAPLTILVENETPDPVQVAVSLTGERGQGEVPGHTLSISPGVGKQFTMLISPQTSGANLRFLAERDVIWMNKDVDVAMPEASRDFYQPLTGGRGLRSAVNPVVVMGGRARQLVGALQGGYRGEALREGRGEYGREVWFCELEQKYAPDNQLGWAGVSLLIWTEPDAGAFGDEAQYEALRNWVACGGRVVMLSATQPRLLTATDLRPLLPVTIEGVKTVPYPFVPIEPLKRIEEHPNKAGLHFLSRYHDARERWIEDATGPLLQARPDPSAVFAPAGSNWSELSVLGWRGNYGAGGVFVAAYDPLVYDRGDVYPLLQATAVAADMEFRRLDGYRGGPAESAFLSRVSKIETLLINNNVLELSLGPYLLLAVLFLLLIGPADYLLLNRLKKLRYSAFTLVGYALLFSCGAVFATYYLFAPAPQTNRVAYVDFTELADGSEYASGYVMHGTYRPLGDTYTCDVDGCLVQGNQVQRSGTGDFGSYAGPGRHPVAVDQPFNSFRMTQSLFAGKPRGTLTAKVTEEGEAWHLDITNGLDAPVQACVIRLGRRAVPCPMLEPGQTVRVDLSRKSWQSISNLDTRMAYNIQRTGAKGELTPELCQTLLADAVIGADATDSETPWETRLHEGEGVVYGITTAWPFTDSFGTADTGFNATVVRRRVLLPASLREALKERHRD